MENDSKTNDKSRRCRFTSDDDLVLLREVLAQNPFENTNKWKTIYANTIKNCNKEFSIRFIKDHLGHLLKLFEKEDTHNLRKSGTEEQYTEKHKLLQEILDLRKEFDKGEKKTSVGSNSDRATRKRGSDCTEMTANTFYNLYNDNTQNVDGIVLKDEYGELQDHSYIIDESSNTSSSPPPVLTHTLGLLAHSNIKRKKVNVTESLLEYLKEKNEKEDEFKVNQLNLEERKVKLEERKLDLEERRIALQERQMHQEEQRLILEVKEREAQSKMVEIQQMMINQLFSRYCKNSQQSP